ncbi:hypothetical protein OESDEN_20935 [Oesophagostomum dentatum]|uniref:SGNH domain-containing protein n=1 Tax=Oesophagostomum dentatum TaxID=61180 RepID=A0A0B1S3B0_OESDE|nr:hypothetical protein OESDEN_20935 [Oesophagostomum dentatum]
MILYYPANESHFMSSKYLTYIGYISYSLYLVHWPVYIYLKQNFIDDYTGLACGIALSVVIAVLFTELFEKECLKSGVKTIVLISACLYIASLSLIGTREGFNFFEQEVNWSKSLFTPHCWTNTSDTYELCDIPFNKSKLTPGQRKRLNSLFTAADVPLLSYERCIYRNIRYKPWGWCNFPPPSNTVHRKILVMGNSYAANQGRIIYEMCNGPNTEVKIYSMGGCEVLVRTAEYNHCRKARGKFAEVVNEYKPDVLFILARYIDIMDAPESKHPDFDDTVQEASEVLQELSQFTTSHIFVLNALPRPNLYFAKDYAKEFSKGKFLASEEMLNATVGLSVGQRRISQAVSTCSKCSIIDYDPVFRVNGTFQLYDADSNVAFINALFHFTPLGLHKLRPFFKNICDHINYSNSSQIL